MTTLQKNRSKTIDSESSERTNTYFAKAIAQRCSDKLWWHAYNLSDRIVLGPTTMDNEMAFIMVHLGRCTKNTIVYDPFCGSGGILIAAAHYGAVCLGSDIDSRVLRGWGVSQVNRNLLEKTDDLQSSDIFRNFNAYSLSLPEILRIDIDSAARCLGRRGSNGRWVDAIITDPPYGIRASVRKCCDGLRNVSHEGLPGTRAVSYLPTSVSEVDTVIRNLFQLATRTLVDHGRLVFFYPVTLATYDWWQLKFHH